VRLSEFHRSRGIYHHDHNNSISPTPDPTVKGPGEPPADGTCLFFKLSAELRNLIYEYALTDEHPLKFKRSANGGKLYTPLKKYQWF
jgi:hypothetical protein